MRKIGSKKSSTSNGSTDSGISTTNSVTSVTSKGRGRKKNKNTNYCGNLTPQ